VLFCSHTDVAKTRRQGFDADVEFCVKIAILLSLVALVGCASRPSLEELEDDAGKTGDWAAVERREELDKKRLEATAPGCPVGKYKDCVEEQTGIVCYCRTRADESGLD